jgi:pullulanase
MPTTKMIQSNLKFIETGDAGLIAYQLTDNANYDKWKNILVILNGNTSPKTIKTPPGKWTLAADENTVNEKGIKVIDAAEITIPATAAYVLYSN